MCGKAGRRYGKNIGKEQKESDRKMSVEEREDGCICLSFWLEIFCMNPRRALRVLPVVRVKRVAT